MSMRSARTSAAADGGGGDRCRNAQIPWEILAIRAASEAADELVAYPLR